MPKPLEWTENGRGWWKAEGVDVTYEVASTMNGKFEARLWARHFYVPIGETFKTLEAAQAACENDYRRKNHA